MAGLSCVAWVRRTSNNSAYAVAGTSGLWQLARRILSRERGCQGCRVDRSRSWQNRRGRAWSTE